MRETSFAMSAIAKVLCAWMVLSTGTIFARTIQIQSLPNSSFADTEVVTNIAIHTLRSDVRQFDLYLRLDTTMTNDLEVALGKDMDNDGILGIDEIETTYGLRGGGCFVENTSECESRQSDATDTSNHAFAIHIVNSSVMVPQQLNITDNGNAIFAEIAETLPTWLYRTSWNMMRIMRRGVGVQSDCVQCEIRYNSLFLTFK